MSKAHRLIAIAGIAAIAGSSHAATLHGTVRDTDGAVVAGANVQVAPAMADRTNIIQTVSTDAQGQYSISSLAAGSYTLTVSMGSLRGSTIRPVSLTENDKKTVDLVLKPVAAAAEFFDEPTFAVAGVTENTYVGGHGSETVMRSTEALTKAAASLEKTPTGIPAAAGAEEKSLRARVAAEPGDFLANDQLGRFLFASGDYTEALVYLKKAAELNPKQAAVHHSIAAADERVNDPLDAVREYQKAAELDPSETNLFDWGTELLIHKAPEPAVQVFNSGIQRFPLSSRMLLGAAVAAYARGDFSQAARRFFQAADLNPADPVPYMFLGKLQAPQITQSDGLLERLARFAAFQPQNAWANYYYAVALWNRRKSPDDTGTRERVESLLQKAVRLDPRLAPAFFESGVVYLDKHDTQEAIRVFKKALEIDPGMEQAHYDLAQAYRQSGNLQEAQKEIEMFRKLSEASAEQLAKQRSELQQFVFALKSPASN
ncbi:MAG: tetratricopeptide repeat protein [Acidobacteriaceae bacterium]|nr:tetratricopeptide repeat protein [Acidobacteriaceae bacterium]